MTAREKLIEMITSADSEDLQIIQETIISFLTLPPEERAALLLHYR